MSRDGAKDDTLYEERIFSRWVAAILGAVAGVMLIIAVWFMFLSAGIPFAFTMLYLVLGGVLLFLTLNFSHLLIRLTPHHIEVGYRFIRKRVPWEDVVGCEPDETSALRYGGWGLRIARVKGRWRVVYNLIGVRCVVLSIGGSRFDDIVFSTERPDEVVRVVHEVLRSRAERATEPPAKGAVP